MKAAKPWMTLVLLGGMLAAGGCEKNGEGQLAEDGPDVVATSWNGSSPSSAASGFSLFPAAATPLPDTKQSPSPQHLLTEEDAISNVKQLHGHNGEVRFSAELQRGTDYEGGKRDIWRVEALFPAGNRWWYSLDAADGSLLVLTELEAPSAEVAIPAFKPYLTETEKGLRLEWDKTLHPDVTIMQTLVSPEANKLAVHLVRRLAYVKGREQFLMDAVIVDPTGNSLRTVPLADVVMNDGLDSYTGSSFAVGHGFDREERLILTVPATRQGRMQYDVQALDIRTGITSLLVQNVIPDPNPDWLAKGWLSSAGDTLVLNLYQSGGLWTADLQTGRVQPSSAAFPHLWPLINLYPSPDGERFIYLGKQGGLGLYTADGKHLAELPGKEGVYATPPAAWSPDGRYFALETTPGKTGEDVIWSGENRVHTIAPKQVLFYDRDGKPIADIQAERYKPGGRMEFAGWLADGSAAVLHAFKLEPQEDVPKRVQSAYYLMDSENAGSLVSLAEAGRIEAMARPESIFSKGDGRLVFIDRVSRSCFAQGGDYSEAHHEQGMMTFLVSAPGEEPLRWTASQQGATTLYSYFPGTRKPVQTPLTDQGSNFISIGPDMVFSSAEGYLRLK